ncbi:MAG: hypothetical protein RIT26_2008 [Pseudomonadota bacterium]|jgi:hypothetical protein
MSKLRRRAVLIAGMALCSAHAQRTTADPWFEALDTEQGRHRFKFWGFDVYEAVLRVGPAFEPQAYDRHPMALSLTYARAFKGADIARRSVEEIERQAPLDPATRQKWGDLLSALFPDVNPGDTLMGAYRPAQGVQLWRRAGAWQWVGDITDMALARRFMGIWLSSATSQPAMRAALLGLRPA